MARSVRLSDYPRHCRLLGQPRDLQQEQGRYEIHDAVSVDESKIGVTDDPYTNAAAKKNLEIAIPAA